MVVVGKRTHWVRYSPTVGLALVILGGCAGAGAAGRRGDDVTLAGLRQETERLRGEVAELRAQLEAARQAVAWHVDLWVGEVRRELEAVEGALQATVRDSDQRQAERWEVQQKRLAAIEKRTEDLNGALRSLEVSVNGLADHLARVEALSAPDRPTADSSRAAKAGGLGARGVAAGSLPERLFDRAMDRFRKGEHRQAVLEFSEIVKTYPATALAGTAQFWIGEAYFKARDFERAAAEYGKAVELAPQGKETPEALLKLGLSYRAFKRENRAREVWARLIRDFPTSEAAQQARKALREK